MSSARRRRAWRRGFNAETVCVVWLLLHGYRIVERRLRTPVGEIDIVARRGGILAIIEVKARNNPKLALESLGIHQRRRLERAAQWLIAGRTDLASLDIRFDVMTVSPWRLPGFIVDAWRPDGAALDRTA